MVFDDLYARYDVSYPFQITCFRTLFEQHWDNKHTFSGESHNFWEFSCILDGEMEVSQDEKIYLLQPGSFICCPPMVFHRSRNLERPCHFLNFSFEHTGTLPACFSEGAFHLSTAEIDALISIIHRLQTAYQQEPPDLDIGAEAACALTSFLIQLSKNHKPHTRLSDSRSSVQYQKLVQTMRESICENLTIQQIAAQNAISVTTAKELFHKYAGISPKAYYTEMRGNEALRLLESGKEIIEISELLNYSSPNYFSCSFKKQFGYPPGQYRKQLRDEQESHSKKQQ